MARVLHRFFFFKIRLIQIKNWTYLHAVLHVATSILCIGGQPWPLLTTGRSRSASSVTRASSHTKDGCTLAMHSFA
jgi:hypothetical protein